MKKLLFLSSICLLTAQFSLKANEVTVAHSNSGEMATALATALNTTDASSVTKLIVAGDAHITLQDCRAIRDKFLSNTKGTFTLDFSNASFEDDSIPGINTGENGAFHGMTALGEVILPENIRVIGYRAFRLCDNLRTINLNDGLQKIMDYAFQQGTGDRPFNILSIPNTVEYIGPGAFENAKFLTMTNLPANLKGVIGATTFKATKVSCTDFPVGVTAINGSTTTSSGAFNCIAASLATFTAITFHEGITSIGNNAFRNQTKITSLTFESAIPPIATSDSPFSSVIPADVTVTVPQGALAVYQAHVAFDGMNIVEAVPTAINNQKSVNLNVFPNPVIDGFSISGDADIKNIQLYDISGRLVEEFSVKNTVYNISHLPKGVYVVKINNENTLKLIKE